MSFQTVSALRIYLSRGDNATPTRFWQRLFRKPLATHLLQQALKAGVTHASLSLGHMGFAKGAKIVAADVTEIPMTTLPVCLELVAPKPMLEQFVRLHAKEVTGATLVMLEGVHIMPLVIDGDLKDKPHHVEYIKAGDVELKVDHVEMEAKAASVAR